MQLQRVNVPSLKRHVVDKIYPYNNIIDIKSRRLMYQICVGYSNIYMKVKPFINY